MGLYTGVSCLLELLQKLFITKYIKTMNVQKLAKLFAIVFVLVGVLGFVPGITTDGHLLGIFEVNTLHNIIHLATGLVAFWAANSVSNSRLFFKVFGIVYLLVTVLGFMQGGVLGLIDTNMADNLLHLVIAAAALYAGFGMKQ
jgi:hypothetical protein